MKKIIAFFYSINGLAMLFIWAMLILTNQVPELESTPGYIAFHLTAEALTAILCLAVGIGLLAQREWAARLYFPSTGALLAAGYLAMGYYISSGLLTNLGMLIMLVAINAIAIALLVSVLRKGLFSDSRRITSISLVFKGALIYTLINVIGFLLEDSSGYIWGYISLIFILLAYTVWMLVGTRQL